MLRVCLLMMARFSSEIFSASLSRPSSSVIRHAACRHQQMPASRRVLICELRYASEIYVAAYRVEQVPARNADSEARASDATAREKNSVVVTEARETAR